MKRFFLTQFNFSKYSLILRFSLCNSLIKTTPSLLKIVRQTLTSVRRKGGGGKQTDYVNIVNTKLGFLGSYLLRRPLCSLNQNLDRKCCLCVLLWVSKAWKYLTRLSLHSISEPFGHLHLIISKYISKLFNIINVLYAH